jgi:hypothetical protein
MGSAAAIHADDADLKNVVRSDLRGILCGGSGFAVGGHGCGGGRKHGVFQKLAA